MLRMALIIFAATASLIAADFSGTWKLNVEKSRPRFSLASDTTKIEEAPPYSVRTTLDQILKSGEKRHQEISRICDGKEHPVTGVGFKQEAASEICERLDTSTIKITQKRDGKEVSEFTSHISPDGKVMTIVRKGGGDETLVFERQ